MMSDEVQSDSIGASPDQRINKAEDLTYLSISIGLTDNI
jgi:hypothetical protein